MKNNNTVMTILIAIIVGAAAFFGGMKYQQSKTVAGAGGRQFGQRGQAGALNNGQRAGGGGQARRGGFGGGTIGKILSMDADSITLQLMDGSSKIVNVSSATTISKTAPATKTELKTGDTVAAIGTTNADGSVTAERIQLNPPQMMNRQATPSALPMK